jgi:hypothetical protein
VTMAAYGYEDYLGTPPAASPEVPEFPGMPESPEAAGYSEMPESLEEADYPGTPESSEASEYYPQKPESPLIHDIPDMPEFDNLLVEAKYTAESDVIEVNVITDVRPHPSALLPLLTCR